MSANDYKSHFLIFYNIETKIDKIVYTQASPCYDIKRNERKLSSSEVWRELNFRLKLCFSM